MNTNHQMNYYDYAKTLSAEGVITALIGGGAGPEPEQHEYVDLGLSVKWATCNIGANTPEEAGLYFDWGETQGCTAEQVGVDKHFCWDEYKFGNPDDDPSTLVTDSLIDENNNLKPEYDAAVANWGEGWRMPTREEFEELTANTEYEWTTVNDVQGAKFTSTVEGYTDKFLFFPAVGDAGSSEVNDVGNYGYFWSVSLDGGAVDCGWKLRFEDGNCEVLNGGRYYGYCVRPVRSNN